jgi:hypothetical protein
MRLTGEEFLAITSNMSDRSRAAAVFAHFRGPIRLFALLPALISLAVSASAWGDIFKWTDEQGRTNISNVPPPTSGKTKNIEVVLKEAKPASIAQHVATPTEQALLARIEALERQLESKQYSAPAPAAPAATPYGSYYPATPPPPPPSSRYYGSGSYGSYPVYYPSSYYPVASTYVVYPTRTYLPRPVFVAPRGGHSHGGGGHSGRH